MIADIDNIRKMILEKGINNVNIAEVGNLYILQMPDISILITAEDMKNLFVKQSLMMNKSEKIAMRHIISNHVGKTMCKAA